MESQFQSMPTSLSYRFNARTHAFSNTPASVHSRNLRCADELEQMPVPLSAFQWQPVLSTNKIAFIASRSGTRGLWQPNGWAGRGGERLEQRPQLFGNPPTIIFGYQSHARMACTS